MWRPPPSLCQISLRYPYSEGNVNEGERTREAKGWTDNKRREAGRMEAVEDMYNG